MVPPWLQRVATPLIWREWDRNLISHPDPEFRHDILRGIRNGFWVGFNRGMTCRSAPGNLHTVLENAAVVQDYLAKEISLGCIVGPISPKLVPNNTQISKFGVIQKSSQPGKWCLIVDLSSPANNSVNDGIEPSLCHLRYLRLDDVLQAVAQSGRGTLLAKMDVESTYQIVPVNPQNRPLLAVQWAGQLFYDTRLPFGLRSVPNIFTALADALQWSFQEQGVSWVGHYLDDYITMPPPPPPPPPPPHPPPPSPPPPSQSHAEGI